MMIVGAMSVPAMAAETKDVTASYVDAVADAKVSIGYSWGSMEFTYSESSKDTWDPKTHTYSGGGGAGGWTCASGANAVKVVNHSNCAVNVGLNFNANSNYSGITGNFAATKLDGEDTPKSTIPSAEGTTVAEAPNRTFYLNLEGALPSGTTNAVIGTLTLNVTQAA